MTVGIVCLTALWSDSVSFEALSDEEVAASG